jgi:hypothetical protein
MTSIEQLERDLPNGFHDAELCGVKVDYERGEVVMTIDADVSDAEASISGEPEYRRCELIIKGLAFLSMDVPRSISEPKPLWLTSGAGQPSTSPIELPPLPPECFVHWFFVSEWSGFIRVAARETEFRWANGEAT